MDQTLKSTPEKKEHTAIKKLQEDIVKSFKNIAFHLKKRNQESELLKSKQEEKCQVQEEVVKMQGQLRYDKVQMPSIEANLCIIEEENNLIEGYTTKIKTVLPTLSDTSLAAIKGKLDQNGNYVHEFLRELEMKFQDTEKERALLEERKLEVKQKFQEAIECLNSNGLNVTNNLKRLKRNKQALQEIFKQTAGENEVVMQNIERVAERKALLKKQFDDKLLRQSELVQEVDQQKVVFEQSRRENGENLTNLFVKIQEMESKRKMLELENVKNEGSAENMLKELEIKKMENTNLKLKNDELAIGLNEAESKMEEDYKKLEKELSSKSEECEMSKIENKKWEAALEDYKKNLVLGKQAKKEIDLKIEDQNMKLEKLKVECEQLQTCVKAIAEKIERLTKEFSITQEEIVSLNAELLEEKENENVQGENEIKEIELEIVVVHKKNDEAIAEIMKGNNQLATEFEQQTKNEMKCFEKESREIEKKIRALKEKLDDDSLAIKDLEEGVTEKDEEIEGLQHTKSFLKPAMESSPVPLKRTRKATTWYSQTSQASASKPTRLKNLATYSQTLQNKSTRSRQVGANKSFGLKELDVNSHSIMSPSSKRQRFDETSNSSTEGVSYDFKAFSALRQEQVTFSINKTTEKEPICRIENYVPKRLTKKMCLPRKSNAVLILRVWSLFVALDLRFIKKLLLGLQEFKRKQK